MPDLFIIAGPNGAGKTTLAYSVIPHILTLNRFLNADNIARGISPLAPQNARISAGKILLQQSDEMISQKISFAFETTLASKGHMRTIRKAQEAGFICHLSYIWLPDVNVSMERVLLRVSKGGHNIAQQDILRRYPRSIDHFWNHYRLQADTWRLYANPDKGHQIIAEGQENNYTVHNEDLWKQATHHQSV